MSTWIFGYGSLIHKPGFAYTRRVEGYIRGYRRVWWQGSTDHRGTPEAPGRTVTLTPDPDAVTWGVAFELAGSPQEQQQVIQYLEWREKQYDVRLSLPVYAVGPPVVDIAAAAAASAEPRPPPVAAVDAATPAAHPVVAGGAGEDVGAAAGSSAAARVGADPLGTTASGAAAAAAGGHVATPAEGAQPAVAAAVVYYATNNPATNLNFLGPASQEAIAQQIAAAAGPSGPNHEYVYKLADAMRQMGVDDPDLYQLERRVRAIRGDPLPVQVVLAAAMQPSPAAAVAAATATIKQNMQAVAAAVCDSDCGSGQGAPVPPAAGAAAEGSPQAATGEQAKAQPASVLELTATCTAGS